MIKVTAATRKIPHFAECPDVFFVVSVIQYFIVGKTNRCQACKYRECNIADTDVLVSELVK
ncbi:hypothetical protein HDF22_005063 [Mucilaginibacter lappiensis]|uniref:Uncharacterized protein n=1 Tax=Mucilaginibacter lappiensis TaxID=354630 RepID=A0A841JJ04_9SPHI|nr:hypothetical protein [Mucilaginibacter lappiensis]